MKKKPDKVLKLLLDIAENMKQCGHAFNEYEITKDTDLKAFSDHIKSLESQGDTLVHETIVQLNQAFITPIEQEDILLLAERMDEVVDGMEDCAIYFYMSNIAEEDEYIKDFRKYISLCTEELQKAIEFLATKQLKAIKEHTVNVKSYEEICDAVERRAIRRLFSELKDEPLKVIEYKDLYQQLEKTVDDCQLVAKALDAIVMKNL